MKNTTKVGLNSSTKQTKLAQKMVEGVAVTPNFKNDGCPRERVCQWSKTHENHIHHF